MEKNLFKITKHSITDMLYIVLGTLISAIGINMFLSHAKLLSGGVTGIALILEYMFNIPTGIMILLFNIPLFILSYIKLNRKFTIYSIVGTVFFSLSLIFTKPISNILNLNDTLLLCLYGGVLSGLGSGLIFSRQGSAGGFDIIAMVLKKKYSHLDLGKISFFLNIFIVGIGAAIFGINTGLYTLASMYISMALMDTVIKGLNQRKMILVISEKEEEITESLMSNLKRGVTYLYGEGAYTNKQKKILYCIVSLSQVPELKDIVKTIDPKAFISIIDASDIDGKGFRSLI